MTPDADREYDLSLYEYELPAEMIAQRPAEPRDSSRLMILQRDSGTTSHAVFRELGGFLRKGDLLVLNNTRVFPARAFGTRSSTGHVEVLFLRDLGRGRWEAMVRSNGKPRAGEFLNLAGGRLSLRLVKKQDAGHWVASVPRGTDLLATLDEFGTTPLPPYIKRGESDALEALDRERYQTVYASETGAAAAPTAGLHFTHPLLEELGARGVETAEVTLHVGAGTFQPIKEPDVRHHKMHEEFYSIGDDAAGKINEAKQAARRVIAVGTTACRALEAAAQQEGGVRPCSGWTKLYVYPPYEFRIVDGLLTNFHLPHSTLLVLVAAFAGRKRILRAYEEAKRRGYRFYSYGDAMLIV